VSELDKAIEAELATAGITWPRCPLCGDRWEEDHLVRCFTPDRTRLVGITFGYFEL
jgi:hypothetical protein